MFSTFVQNIAHPRPSSDSNPARPTSPAKHLQQHRPASPSPHKRTTLEDRLRASFTIGDASSSEPTPVASTRASPSPPKDAITEEQPTTPQPTTVLPLSPSSTPLPDSPVASPIQLEPPPNALPLEIPNDDPDPVADALPDIPQLTNVDALQERLKLVEQRFSDVSTSFKRLRAEKAAADAILRELTPLESVSDSHALRDYVQNIIMKAEMSTGEITRLNGRLETQESRIEELRDTHRLESSSQSAQIEHLKKQLSEAETLISASQGSVAQSTESAAAQTAEIERLQTDIEQSKRVAKEEEEKRVKAISLLKTVRQKLVKAEKDKDDAQREATALKEKEKAEGTASQAEKAKMQAEIEAVNAEREKAVTGLKTQFDKEISGIRERHEKEIATLRGQFELEALTTKSAHTKEVATLTSRVSSLDTSIITLTNDKNALFDQLQLRQAEVESAQSHIELLQSQITELEYQLRESQERFALLDQDISERRQEQDIRAREPSSSAEDIAQLVAATQAKYEVKLADARKNLSVAEKERNESEAQWSRKLREKVRENEELKQALGSTAQSLRIDEGQVEALQNEILRLKEELHVSQAELLQLKEDSASLADVEMSNKAQETETNAKISALEQLLEEAKSREAQLRANSKTLREELRKVQSSAALLERQRNPGVGYWTQRPTDQPETRTSTSSNSSDSRVASPSPVKQEEEVNLEYLRNVILQFLEHKEMRPNLVKVLSIILHFTPQETRSFQGGISPSKWLSFCKLFLSKQNDESPQASQRALSNSVLVLYRSFPGDAVLQEYLKIALQSELLPISIYVSTLLSAARSTELHSPATLDMLCRVALDSHYSSGKSSTDLADYDSPITVLNTLQDALALLTVVQRLRISHFHQLTTSASELVALLFSVVEISQGPPAQCIALLSEANAMLSQNSISQNVRQSLEAFTLSLGLFVGDSDVKASKSSESHAAHLVLGKNDTISSNNDTVSFSLTLNYLMMHRADELGIGSGLDPAKLFVSMFRWSSWAPPVFYTQLILSAFICLTETTTVSPLLWRSFIVSRLPSILSIFEKLVHVDGAPENWRGALQVAVTALMRRTELLERCDRLVNQFSATHLAQEGLTQTRSIFRDLLRQLQSSSLLDLQFILAIDPTHMQTEPQSETNEPDARRLQIDFEDVTVFIDRIWQEPQMHKAFADYAFSRFASAAASLDTEASSFWSRTLEIDSALDMVAMHQNLSELIFHALHCLQEFDCDPQTAVSYLGDVVLFLQLLLVRFHLSSDVFWCTGRQISSRFIRATAVVYNVNELEGPDLAAFNIWYKALFDRNSEGIEDTILRSVKPKTLLKISATLFSFALKDPNIDSEVLNNGISYFTGGPLLKWTLVGVVANLMQEIRVGGFSASTTKHFHVLRTLLLSQDCPRAVKCLCGQGLTSLLNDKRSQNGMPPADATAMLNTISQAWNHNTSVSPQQVSTPAQILGYPRRAIREAIGKARASKAPTLDIDRCINICGPEKFLRTLWSELLAPGDMDVCVRLATFAITIPRLPGFPPLMPTFFHTVLPNLISNIDTRQVGDQQVPGDLLGAIISSILTASLHLDVAFNELPRPILGQPSAVVARRLAADLRFKAQRQSNVSRIILQRLGSSQSIVNNFPIFKPTA
ncbi:Mediator of RNA polymerase II transcription subunit 5 [Mycena indigotica]|uniref:Mediator of RNA polymerase II transcription subunit 5 n=1 Tax=Mycena indigotica TaxID=2126181 RepID=A0A8H6W8J7_9AGAR|nr:Mediator of RNA polymerase II transcription subunit 5 [Mycena indigotica]KAF7306991.1 Mediator of RNA polymerase II transcription subunit 5 [Mycena indigotica]